MIQPPAPFVTRLYIPSLRHFNRLSALYIDNTKERAILYHTRLINIENNPHLIIISTLKVRTGFIVLISNSTDGASWYRIDRCTHTLEITKIVRPYRANIAAISRLQEVIYVL